MDIASNRVKNKIKQITDLPTIPAVVSRLIKTLQNENASIDDLSEVIRYDQSLTTRIVAAANSPFFGYPGKINSIEQAILMLGFDFTKSISLGVSILSSFPLQHDTLKKMWAHSYGVATLSGLMCPRIPVADKGVCFLAGLLHDIGRAVFMKLYGDEYSVLLKTDDLIAAEMDTFQCNHAQLGGWFLENLSFPEEIILPVYHHHSVDGTIKHKGIVTAVYLAEGLISLLDQGIACDGQWTEEHEKMFEESGLTGNNIKAYESLLHEELESINNFFKL